MTTVLPPAAHPDQLNLSDPSVDNLDQDLFVFPTSFAQRRLWFLSQLAPQSPFYNVPLSFRLHGQLDIDALRQSLNQIVDRHETLRTTFSFVDGEPVQIVAPSRQQELLLIDLSQFPEVEKGVEVSRLATLEAQAPFDLTKGPLLRSTLLRLGANEHLMLLTTHHIISDGWSVGILVRELAILYDALCTGVEPSLADLPVQYADFALWQRDWSSSVKYNEQLNYWKRQLDGISTLELHTDRVRPTIQSFSGDHQHFTLDKKLTDQLKVLSERSGVTQFMTLLAAFQALLYRYTNQNDIVVGSPIANRNREEIEGLIGFFANTLVFRTEVTGELTFRELLQRVKDVTLSAYANQDLPFDRLVEELQPARTTSSNPLFQVTMALQNAPADEMALSGLSLQQFNDKTRVNIFESLALTKSTRVDIELHLWEKPEGITGGFLYSSDLFDADTIRRMGVHFTRMLELVCVNPDTRLSELPLLTNEERDQILWKWNDTLTPYPISQCIQQLFETHAEALPEKEAIVCGDNKLTYSELNERANQLAHYLRDLGVGPEVLVGISVERSIEMVIALLAVLKAGGAYVPLDPAYPRERLAFMLEDAGVRVLLTQKELVAGLPTKTAEVVFIDCDWELISRKSSQNLDSGVSSKNLAYVIYTSGSTGKPKGVMVEHRGLANLGEAQLRAFDLSPADRVLQFSSLSFDASIFEMVMAWKTGATLCLATGDTLVSGEALGQLLSEQRVTNVVLTPSVLTGVANTNLPALKTVTVAGEACPAQLVQRWSKGRRFFNLYGPTEVTVWATFVECSNPDQAPPIGRPIANAEVYLLDKQLQPVPVGVVGELHIGGVGLARGYLNRPELTAARFIPHPFKHSDSARLYKSGDLGRYLPDGQIEFAGRIDHQVKLRGLRIELGEIEAALRQIEVINDSLVIVREDTSGERRLVAYVVAEKGSDNASTSTSELRRILKSRLPEYMVPGKFVTLEALPLTPNGKLDRDRLPAPDDLRPDLAEAYVAPQSELERNIAEVWQQTLRVEKIGRHDNFFELGGHSLDLTRVHVKLANKLEQQLMIIDLFQYPTIASLAAYLNPQQSSEPVFIDVRSRAQKQRAILSQRTESLERRRNGNGRIRK
jgi:amino acid adenylation domain-containing protein